MKRVLAEGFLVAIIGAVFAFSANTLSPRGLALSRDYFPKEPRLASTNRAPLELLAAQLAEKGIHLADSNQVDRLFHDPRLEQNFIVFIDARTKDHYQSGHIPGAYELDYFHPENYVGEVMGVCQVAEHIVVYCHGGNCEDSQHVANLLRDAGVPGEKLWVYSGGISEWCTNGMPVEFGDRKSGQLLPRESKTPGL